MKSDFPLVLHNFVCLPNFLRCMYGKMCVYTVCLYAEGMIISRMSDYFWWQRDHCFIEATVQHDYYLKPLTLIVSRKLITAKQKLLIFE